MDKVDYCNEQKATIVAQQKRVQQSTPWVLLFLAGVAYAIYYDKIDLGRYQNVTDQQLDDLAHKIVYVLRHSTPGVVWLMFCFFYVLAKRIDSPAIMPATGHEQLTEVARNIFLNSLEQFVMLFVSQMILVTYLTGHQVMNIIPTLNILYFAGRVLFFLGYPVYRSPGFVTGFMPLISIVIYISYRYINLFCAQTSLVSRD